MIALIVTADNLRTREKTLDPVVFGSTMTACYPRMREMPRAKPSNINAGRGSTSSAG